MKSKYQKVKGTFDITPENISGWTDAKNKLYELAEIFGYKEIITPTIEYKELFEHSAGEDVDVTKEMFSWTDLNDKSICLKPEMTAPVVRAFIEGGFYRSDPLSKFFYFDSLFRREKPQKGRQRQFHQFGVEVFGSYSSEQDAEVILFALEAIKKLQIKEYNLKINNIGSGDTRILFVKHLKQFLKDKKSQLSPSAIEKIESNPLRILDSKYSEDIETLRDAPKISNFLSAEEKDNFSNLQDHLNSLEIKFSINTSLVRGLDYYNGNVFEIVQNDNRSQNALCGGGRYDSLVQQFGGPKTGAVGFAAGFERMLLASKLNAVNSNKEKIYVGLHLGNNDLSFIKELVEMNQPFFIDTSDKSIKNKFKKSQKLGFSMFLDLESRTIFNHESKKETSFKKGSYLKDFLNS